MLDPRRFVVKAVEEIKNEVRNKKVVAACSGGVDSTTAAALVNKAIGKNLVGIFVDTGFMRKGEAEKVKTMLKDLGLNLRFVDAKEEFLKAIEDVSDPEEKRKIIGEKFIRIFERVAEEENAEYLVQGTIAPDWIESGDELRDRIKTHHNVAGLPKNMKLKLIEPLRDLYKDEVRKLARFLGIKVSERQPFPGPGLAIRIVGNVTKEKLEIVKEANFIVEDEIDKAVKQGEIQRPWQYFAVLLPVRSVGVHGDIRRYGYVIAVRIVDSVDGMTAEYAKLPHSLLERISTRITNTLGKKVNRVVYDITNKPPGTIEWE
jgi:GMP synthase (glutamine-hydrolysing)